MVTHHQKLSANRGRWLNLDVRAMDTDTARRKKKENLPRDIRCRNGECYKCKSPSLWLRLHTNAHTVGVRMMRHLIYGAGSAPSNVAIDIRVGGWSHSDGFAVLEQQSIASIWKICPTTLSEAFPSCNPSAVIVGEDDLPITQTHAETERWVFLE